jgi:hypothetical protein
MERAVDIEQPPPNLGAVVSTNLDALKALGTQNFFEPSARRRLVVLLTDGESRRFHTDEIAKALRSGPGVKLVIVHVWSADESVFTEDGKREQGYHVNPDSTARLREIASAVGGGSYGEGALGAAAGAVRTAVGTGPTLVQGRAERTRTLAPYVALLALLPLLFVLPRIGRRGLLSALRLFGETQARTGARWVRDQQRRRRHATEQPVTEAA